MKVLLGIMLLILLLVMSTIINHMLNLPIDYWHNKKYGTKWTNKYLSKNRKYVVSDDKMHKVTRDLFITEIFTILFCIFFMFIFKSFVLFMLISLLITVTIDTTYDYYIKNQLTKKGY